MQKLLLGVLGKYTENSKISLSLVLFNSEIKSVTIFSKLHALSFYKPLEFLNLCLL